MRLAIIGGNLLGCSTAFYTRRAFEANAADDSADHETSRSDDTITIFERSPCLGGNKFATLAISKPISVGTAARTDLKAAPAFMKLLTDANINPVFRASQEWAVFDYDADSYILSAVRSRTLDSLAASPLVYLLQLLTLFSTIYFGNLFRRIGIVSFLKVDVFNDRHINYPLILGASITFILGLGIVPLRPLLRFYNRLSTALFPRLISGITYGGHSLSMLSMHAKQTKAHIEAILTQDAATSCITPGHLLSACGLAKFAKVSLTEFLASYNVQKNLLDDFITPSLASTYANTSLLSGDVNALAALLSLLSRSHVPISLRSRAGYLDGEETLSLCDKIADAATAEVKTGVNVTKVAAKGSCWELSGLVGGREVKLGVFDGVILAAVVDPERFVTDAVDDLSSDLTLPKPPNLRVNAAKYVSIVKGKLRTGFVNRSAIDTVAKETTILNSVNCSEVVRVGEDEWRVVTGISLSKSSAICDAMFEHVDTIVESERIAKYGCCPPIRNVHGGILPTFVLGTRFLNAASTDRIANDVNLDVLSARNAASLFRNGIAKWK